MTRASGTIGTEEARASHAGVNSGTSTSPRFVLFLLFLIVTFNLLDRQIINILAQDIKDDLALSDTELGLITGTAFGILKAIVTIPIAWWADRFDRARVLIILLAISSAFTAVCGLANSYLALAMARMGAGMGEGGGVPVATALVRDHVPKRATSALALIMLGNPFGTLLAFLLGGLIAERWGWRTAFICAGLPGLMLAGLLCTKLKDIRAERRAAAGSSACALDVIRLLRRPRMTLLLGATFASLFLVSAANAWLPTILIRGHGLTTGRMGVYGAIAIGIGGGFGTLSGALCDSVRSRVSYPESKLMLMTITLAVPFLALTIFGRTTGAAMLGFLVYNCVAYAWLAPTIRLIQDAAAVDDRALAIAVCSSVSTFLAVCIGIPLTGWISDLLTPQYGARSLGTAAFTTISAAAIVGLTSHSNFLVQIRRTDKKLQC